MSESRYSPRGRFQPGIAAMYACTGASPSAFAICGLPPERRTGDVSSFRALAGLALLVPDLAFAAAFFGGLDLAAGLRGFSASDVSLAFDFDLVIKPLLRMSPYASRARYART